MFPWLWIAKLGQTNQCFSGTIHSPVFGFEDDDWQTVEATVRLAREMKLTSAQFLILTPLPGSELYQRLAGEGRLTSTNWDHYDTHHVVFRPTGFTPFELQCAQVYGHTRLYTLPEGLKKVAAGRWVAAGLSFYAWKINRDWQKGNQPYLRELASGTLPANAVIGKLAPNSGNGWTDASRRPVPAAAS